MALIKTSKSTPSVYTQKSRDFQLIGHIYEAVFNSSKLATDMLDKMMPNPNFDERLLNLSTSTVGFIRKHEYDREDLTMVLSSFAYLLRVKGTKSAIEYAINILLRSQGISDAYIIEVDDKNKEVTLSLSTRLSDTILLLDLFEYLLPFGFNYRIIQAVAAQIDNNITQIIYNDNSNIVQIVNKAIVNDTFNTTIEHTLPTTVNPRPISNGEVQESL